MSEVRKFTPPNRLKHVLNDPRGMTVSSALRTAKSNLAAVRESHLAALDEKLEQLRAIPPAEAADAQKLLFYRLARDVMADAGGLGLTGLSKAALSLCDLMASGATGPKMVNAIAVHGDALAALRSTAGANALIEKAVLEGLVALSRPKPAP